LAKAAVNTLSRAVAEIGEASMAEQLWFIALCALSSCSEIDDSSLTAKVWNGTLSFFASDSKPQNSLARVRVT
jgi:hypothetical protein